MPKNKSFEDRKKILNEMFRSPKNFTLVQIIDRVSENLDISISKKTIQNDIKAIKELAQQRNAELKCIEGRYTYEPKNFNLYEVNIDPYEIARIKLAVAILRQIPGLDLHDDLKNLYDKLEMRDAYWMEEEEFIQFDTRLEYQGAKYLGEIIEAIKGKTVISFDYQSFKSDTPIRVIVHPYLLKEYNNRWFLIGLPQHYREQGQYVIYNYGLERIKSKIKAEGAIEYFKDPQFDAKSYYKNVIGVTIPAGAAVKEIKLKVNANRAKYVETNPLHHTQKIIESTPEYVTFSYELISNQELDTLILSFGRDVAVI